MWLTVSKLQYIMLIFFPLFFKHKWLFICYKLGVYTAACTKHFLVENLIVRFFWKPLDPVAPLQAINQNSEEKLIVSMAVRPNLRMPEWNISQQRQNSQFVVTFLPENECRHCGVNNTNPFSVAVRLSHNKLINTNFFQRPISAVSIIWSPPRAQDHWWSSKR